MDVIDIFRFPIAILLCPFRCPSNPFSLHHTNPSIIQRQCPSSSFLTNTRASFGRICHLDCSVSCHPKSVLLFVFDASGSLRSSLRQWICTHITREPLSGFTLKLITEFYKHVSRVSLFAY